MHMVKPEAVKIVDEKDIRSPINYEQRFVLRYFVNDKANEEEKLKDDILSNILKPECYPFEGRDFKLQNAYNKLKFSFHNKFRYGDQIPLPYDKHKNTFLLSSNVRTGSRKLFNEYGGRIAYSLSVVFIAYVVFSFYYFRNELDSILRILQINKFIKSFDLESDMSGKICDVLMTDTESLVFRNLGDPTKDTLFDCIFNHDYFNDLDEIKEKL